MPDNEKVFFSNFNDAYFNITFACQALRAHKVWLEESRQNKLGNEESTLHDAWATAPLYISPEYNKRHEFRRIGPDEVERKAQRFAHLSESLQNRRRIDAVA